MVKDSNGKIQTRVERVDVVNHSLYNAKKFNKNTSDTDYDTDIFYWYCGRYYLESIPDCKLHIV